MKSRLPLAIACAVAVSAAPAFGQEHTGHEAHQAQSARAAAGAEAPLRVMTPQPAIGNIPLVDHEGRATSLAEAIGSDAPVLVNFIFTTCTTICPVMSTGFSQFQSTLGADRDRVRLISISIDPDTDTAEALRAYAARFGASTSWRFLTGTREHVIAAQRVFGAYRGDKMNHEPVTYLRRAPRSPWEALDGLSSAGALMRAYKGDSGTHQH
ncbi:MAG TPA: SCO family protein [Vicinamibacterales bacterium]|nr:SCO family protein [Vicinamibacterales bacterium]